MLFQCYTLIEITKLYFRMNKYKLGGYCSDTRRKVSIIGAGNTGSTLAFVLAQKELEIL